MDFVTRDEWLSEKLSRPAYVWTAPADADPTACPVLDEPGCFITCKLPVADVGRARSLTAAGFFVVDTALSFDADLLYSGGSSIKSRYAAENDAEAVELIAATSFIYSRFHLDPLLDTAVAHRMKGEWAANYFIGQRGDGMVVAEIEGRVVAFLLLLRAADGRAVIDLIGTDASAQRKGAARSMIDFAQFNGFGNRSREDSGWIVGTQAANAPSCRFYESLGFRLSHASYVLHYHGPRS